MYVGETNNQTQRPNWTDFFIGLAFSVSLRSPDPHTKHGCLIVNKDRHIIGTGYNGFLRGVNESYFPLNRPSTPEEISKYDYVFHAETNALANCTSRPHDCTAYVTGQCCVECTKALYQHGVTSIVMANRHGSRLITAKDMEVFRNIVEWTGIEIKYVQPNLAWLIQELSNLQNSYISSVTGDPRFQPGEECDA